MATIRYFKKEDILDGVYTDISTPLSVGEWATTVFKPTDAFSIYEGNVCKENDITFDVDACVHGHGFYVVIETPTGGLGFLEIATIVSIVISVAAIALMPDTELLPQNIDRRQESPNNELGARNNKARPLQRIPEIKGTVTAIPDVLMLTYYRYLDLNSRVEHGYYCVGRKSIEVNDIKDGGSLIKDIPRASAQVYGPYKSPNNSLPDIQIGTFIDREIITPYRSSDVNQLQLPAINEIGATPLVTDSTVVPPPVGQLISAISYVGDDKFNLRIQKGGTETGWLSPDYYKGNSIILENFITNNFAAPTPIDWSGTYEIAEDPVFGSGPNQTYYDIVFKTDGSFATTFVLGLSLVGSSMRTVFSTPYNEWYYMTDTEYDRGFVNIVCPGGLYQYNSGSYSTIEVGFLVEIEPLDPDPTGITQTVTGYLTGNSSIKRGITVDFVMPYKSKFRIRVKRTTERFTLSGQIIDDIEVEDVYGVVDVVESDFGDVTTIQTQTISYPNGTTISNRGLSCKATEMLYRYLGGGEFDTVLTTNDSAIQSYITDWIDPKFGGQDIADLDADGLLDLQSEIESYFGSTEMREYNYTIDSTKTTFMEYTQLLFNAINCRAYRVGSLLKAKLERLEVIPATVFTHRSKIPGTETYTRLMNRSQLNDGVELTYVDPDTNKNEIIYLPSDKTAQNPKKIEISGIRTYRQAVIRANREYNKIQYAKSALKMTVTGEARFLAPGDMVSVVKGTRMKTCDGDILNVSNTGLILTLSNDVVFDGVGPWSIVLKYGDGSVQAIDCSAGSDTNIVVLSSLPSKDILTDTLEYGRRTEFSFGSDEKLNAQLYYVNEVSVEDHHTVGLTLSNYDERFYSYDNGIGNAFDEGFDDGFA